MIIDTHLHPTNKVDEAWRHTGEPFTGERLLDDDGRTVHDQRQAAPHRHGLHPAAAGQHRVARR